MTATLAEVREAIKDKLQEVAGLDTVYGYYNGSPTPPCAIVGWPETHDLATRLGDTTAWENLIPVQILVGMGDSQAADVRLGAFCDPDGPSSIQEAFDLDPTLGGVITATPSPATSPSSGSPSSPRVASSTCRPSSTSRSSPPRKALRPCA